MHQYLELLQKGEKLAFRPGFFRGMRRLRAEIAPVDSHETSQAVGVDVYMGKARYNWKGFR
jgi:hypothetical protein